MTTERKVIRAKVGLLELAKQLGNVSNACKIMGYSRDSFYRFQELYEKGGELAFHRLQGAAVLYLNLAMIFAPAFSPIWDRNTNAFANLPAPTGGPGEIATMLYFSFTTLTTTGYGYIVPIDPFARSLTNLEAILGQFYLAITVAGLVTLELEDRRR
jgi:hypothetical protein